MRFVIFCHSLASDWNHGNAHFLRGVVTELLGRGHDVVVYEPLDAWSRAHLVAGHGREAVERFHAAYPSLASMVYDPRTPDLDTMLHDADVVIMHEWNDHALVAGVGAHRRRRTARYLLLFHDTHHRLVTRPREMTAYDLRGYDAVLAFGRVLAERYKASRSARRVHVWHEAADVRVFRPRPGVRKRRDLVWVGNWGDDERTAELHEFLLKPVRTLKASARVHGVRYPAEATAALKRTGIEYAGWLANFDAPRAFAEARLTVHVPRRPYVEALPGIPTIRVFEALACGMPLVCSPWEDAEGLFRPGEDYLIARSGREMTGLLRDLLADPGARRDLAARGRETILSRHTCAHRVDELLAIVG